MYFMLLKSMVKYGLYANSAQYLYVHCRETQSTLHHTFFSLSVLFFFNIPLSFSPSHITECTQKHKHWWLNIHSNLNCPKWNVLKGDLTVNVKAGMLSMWKLAQVKRTLVSRGWRFLCSFPKRYYVPFIQW